LPVVWPRHLDDVPRLAEAFPRLSIVIDHLGKPPLDGALDEWAAALDAAAAHTNVTAKVSGVATQVLAPAVAVALGAFGPERLLCGSDWPVASLDGRDYERVWNDTRLAVHDDLRLLAANAVRLYGLPEARDGAH
jgi:L-fuconolactonase